MYDEEDERSNSPSAANNDSRHNNSDSRFESLWKRSETGNIFNKYT